MSHHPSHVPGTLDETSTADHCWDPVAGRTDPAPDLVEKTGGLISGSCNRFVTGDHRTIAQHPAAWRYISLDLYGFANKSCDGFSCVKDDFDAVCRARGYRSTSVGSGCTTATGVNISKDQWGSACIGEPEMEYYGISHRYFAQVQAGIYPVDTGG